MNIFQQITDYVKRDYSTFDMKNNWVGSVNGFGSLNKIYHSVVLPSDTWKLGHNIMVKLPALVAPAFTRIKGIVNSYYCSYASVWNYWNSFISDKPEDVFLSRSLTQSYKGKFVEPCVNMMYISFICKVARGFFNALPGERTVSVGTSNNMVTIKISTLYHRASSTVSELDFIPVPTVLTWTLSNGEKRLLSYEPADAFEHIGSSYQYDWDYSSEYTFSFPFTNANSFREAGFADWFSYFVYQCQLCERNLSNMGVPTDMLASSSISYYNDYYFNLLNSMCDSSIWQNFYRDEQNQSPEFDYREVNGQLTIQNPFNSNTLSMTGGWHLRLLGIPPNVSNGSDYWFKVTTSAQALSVLTGFMLEDVVKDYCMHDMQSTSNINILPKSYNGLLVLKFRNFEKDYFTSACVDPNFGGVSVQVPSTIDALRTASKLEEFLEVSASARDFYNFMKHIFGTNPESTRYQKPLLLGTQVVPVQIGEQLQTSQTTESTDSQIGSPLGQRAGVADGYGNSGTVNHYFNEHGYLVSYLSFVLDSQYMQGFPFELMHHLQLDYPFPQFANLGAESIPLSEIYFGNEMSNSRGVSYTTGDNNGVVDNSTFVVNSVDSEYGNSNYPDVAAGLGVGYSNSSYNNTDASVDSLFYVGNSTPNVFGYTPRYSKWKFKQDVVAGQMRDSLEYWHTFRQFSQRPFISNNFVSYMNAGFLSNLNRIFAVVNDNADKFVVDVFNNGSVRRCLPLVPQTTMD